jgi:hypothetical protein
MTPLMVTSLSVVYIWARRAQEPDRGRSLPWPNRAKCLLMLPVCVPPLGVPHGAAPAVAEEDVAAHARDLRGHASEGTPTPGPKSLSPTSSPNGSSEPDSTGLNPPRKRLLKRIGGKVP